MDMATAKRTKKGKRSAESELEELGLLTPRGDGGRESFDLQDDDGDDGEATDTSDDLWRRHAIDCGEMACQAKLLTAEDGRGQWMGTVTVKWDPPLTLVGLDGVFSPESVPHFDTENDVLQWAAEELANWCEQGLPDTTGIGRTCLQKLRRYAQDAAAEYSSRGANRSPNGKAKKSTRATGSASAQRESGRALAEPVAPDPKPAAVFRKTPEAAGYTILEFPVDKIHRRPSNRGGVAVTFPEVADLVASIEQFGLSTPIEVRDASEEQELPFGHYELVKGERRWTACRALHRDTMPAIVRSLDEAAAAVQVVVDNTQRRDLNPIERAKAIRDAIAHGVPEDQAAAAAGVPKGAKNALRLLELPEAIQQAVAAGELQQKVALALVPYRELDAMMEEILRDIQQEAWWLTEDRQDFAHHIERMVDDFTRRPASCQPKRNSWEKPKPVVPDKQLTPELRAELGEVVVRINNKPTTLFTNVKRYDELARAHEEEAKAVADARKRKQEAKAKTEGKPANPKAEKHQDELLQKKADEWRHRFLRCGIAQALVPGDARTALVCEWLRITLDDARYETHRKVLVITEAVAEQFGKPVRHKSTGYYTQAVKCWDLVQDLMPWDADPLRDRDELDCQRAKWLLWPQAAKGKPPRVGKGVLAAADEPVTEDLLVSLNHDDVEAIAKWLSETRAITQGEAWRTAFAHGWTRSAEPGPERVMFEELIGYCNKRQLLSLAADMLIVLNDGKLDAMRQIVLAAHVGRGVAIPKLVNGKKPKAAKKASHGRKPTGTTKPTGAKSKAYVAGICRVCACTEDNPCDEGCGWADDTRTLCTQCVDDA